MEGSTRWAILGVALFGCEKYYAAGAGEYAGVSVDGKPELEALTFSVDAAQDQLRPGARAPPRLEGA